MSGEFAYSRDDGGGYAADADLRFDLTSRVFVGAGLGRTVGSMDTGGIRGTLAEVSAGYRGERAGASLRYSRFDDSTNYQAGTLAARAWLALGGFQIALLGRHRDLSARITLELPLRLVTRDVEFSARGSGAELSWSHGGFGAYVMALEYDYDDGFDDFIDLIDSPQLGQRPRLEALVASVVTQTQGVVDRQFGAGAEYGFGTHLIALDLGSVYDAVRETRSDSIALSYRQAPTSRLDWGVTAGMADSDTFGDIAFVGFNVGLAN